VLYSADKGRVEPAVSRPARFAPGLAPFAWLEIHTVHLLLIMVVKGIAGRR
jgi:hypothetical protein